MGGALPAMLAATWPRASIGIEHDDSGFPAHMLEGVLIPQPTNSPRYVRTPAPAKPPEICCHCLATVLVNVLTKGLGVTCRPVGHSTRVMLLDDDGNHGAG